MKKKPLKVKKRLGKDALLWAADLAKDKRAALVETAQSLRHRAAQVRDAGARQAKDLIARADRDALEAEATAKGLDERVAVLDRDMARHLVPAAPCPGGCPEKAPTTGPPATNSPAPPAAEATAPAVEPAPPAIAATPAPVETSVTAPAAAAQESGT